MVKKANFEQRYFDFPMHECFYCGEKPTGILTIFKTGEEIRTCKHCAVKYGKIRRLKKSICYALAIGKQTKINQNPLVNYSKNEVLI